VTAAVGKSYKLQNGTLVQVVGVVEDGKYMSLTEDQLPAMFLPFLQSPVSSSWLVARSNRDPRKLAAAIRSKLRELDAGLPVDTQSWNGLLEVVLFPSRMKELGIRLALGAQRTEVLQAALGRSFKLLAFGSAAGLLLGILASRVQASIVYQATPRDPLVLGGLVLTTVMLGLLATWIPAQRALSVDPLILLRED